MAELCRASRLDYLRDFQERSAHFDHVIKYFLAWLTAIALAAMPVAAWATAPCPMSASGQMAASSQMAAMDHASGSPMHKSCDRKSAKACTEICTAMAGFYADLPATITLAMPTPVNTKEGVLSPLALVSRQSTGLDRPPRTII